MGLLFKVWGLRFRAWGFRALDTTVNLGSWQSERFANPKPHQQDLIRVTMIIVGSHWVP